MMIYIKLVASMAIWGGTWVAGRVVSAEMTPFCAAFLRFLFASGFMIAVALRETGHLPVIRRSQLPYAVLLGMTGVFLYNACFFLGLKTVEAGRASLIIAGVPSFIALFSWLVFREKMTATRLVGVPLSLAGVAVVITEGDFHAVLDGGFGFGELCILGCVASWTAYSLIGKKAMASMSPADVVTWSCIFGSIMLFIPALNEGLMGNLPDITYKAWGNLAYLGILATGVAFQWYYDGIRTLGPCRAGVFINLVPLAAIGLGVVILGEHPTLWLVLGGAMVISGVWLTNRVVKTSGGSAGSPACSSTEK